MITASLEKEVLFSWLSGVPNVGWGANGMVWVREGILQWKWIHTAMNMGEDLYMTAWEGRLVSILITSESKVGWEIKSTDALAVLMEGTSAEVIGLAAKTKVLVEGTEGWVRKRRGRICTHRYWGFILEERWLEEEDWGPWRNREIRNRICTYNYIVIKWNSIVCD